MKVEDFDWDRFEAEGEEIARRMRKVSRTMAEQNAASRAERARYEERKASGGSVARETPRGAPLSVEGRLDRLEARLDGVETRLDGVETRLDRVEARLDGVEARLDGVEARLGGVETRLGSVEARLGRVEVILSDIRDRMATKIELEAMRDSVQMVADGYAQTQHRLAETSGLLKRYLTTE